MQAALPRRIGRGALCGKGFGAGLLGCGVLGLRVCLCL